MYLSFYICRVVCPLPGCYPQHVLVKHVTSATCASEPRSTSLLIFAVSAALMLSAKRPGASVMVNAANPHSVSLRRWWLIANQRLRHQPSAPIPAGRSSAPPTTTSPAERPPPNRGGGSYSTFRSGTTREVAMLATPTRYTFSVSRHTRMSITTSCPFLASY
jgi:hypothetical protein